MLSWDYVHGMALGLHNNGSGGIAVSQREY